MIFTFVLNIFTNVNVNVNMCIYNQAAQKAAAAEVEDPPGWASKSTASVLDESGVITITFTYLMGDGSEEIREFKMMPSE